MRLVRAPWNAAFLQEHEQFPLGEHDDQVDGVTGGFHLLHPDAATGKARNRALDHFNPWGNPWGSEDIEP